jgi:DNA-binding NtrC family response regulator
MKPVVLVADDDPSLRITVAANLEEAGFDILEAQDGLEALEIVRARPDLAAVVSDIRMPKLDGAKAFRQIRLLRPELPVILMTAFTLERVVQDVLVEGVFTVLPKPFDTERLAAVVANAITRPVVLVVDDAAEQRDSIRASLIACGCDAVCAATADEATTALEKNVVDVALVDLVMPDRDGVRVLEDLLRVDGSVGVITMTGHDVPELIRAASRRGSRAALRKPFDVAHLIKLIADLRRSGA